MSNIGERILDGWEDVGEELCPDALESPGDGAIKLPLHPPRIVGGSGCAPGGREKEPLFEEAEAVFWRDIH